MNPKLPRALCIYGHAIEVGSKTYKVYRAVWRGLDDTVLNQDRTPTPPPNLGIV